MARRNRTQWRYIGLLRHIWTYTLMIMRCAGRVKPAIMDILSSLPPPPQHACAHLALLCLKPFINVTAFVVDNFFPILYLWIGNLDYSCSQSEYNEMVVGTLASRKFIIALNGWWWLEGLLHTNSSAPYTNINERRHVYACAHYWRHNALKHQYIS